MRSRDDVNVVRALVAAGLNDPEISRQTGIPRRTIADWRCGKWPRSGGCGPCSYIEHLPLPRSYAYLLGMYLGDGCLSRRLGSACGDFGSSPIAAIAASSRSAPPRWS